LKKEEEEEKMSSKVIRTKKSYDEKYDLLYKIILLGDPGVGKTSLVRCLRNDPYHHIYIPTIAYDFSYHFLRIEGLIIKLQIM
jgi:Ras-related protein Rab-1A